MPSAPPPAAPSSLPAGPTSAPPAAQLSDASRPGVASRRPLVTTTRATLQLPALPRLGPLLRLAALLVLVLGSLLVLGAGSTAAAPLWGWPLPPPHPVSRPFAPGPQPWSPGHRGVDLAAPAGSAVLAAGAGRVTFAGALVGRGVVVVEHGVLRTTYEPVTAAVQIGTAVRTGDVLGHLDPGHPGCPVAACLHWGLLRAATYLDPLSLVTPGSVRLLPRAGGAPDAPAPAAATAPGAAAAYAAPPGVAGPTSASDPRPSRRDPSAAGRAAPGRRAAAVTTVAAGLLAGFGMLRRPGRRHVST